MDSLALVTPVGRAAMMDVMVWFRAELTDLQSEAGDNSRSGDPAGG